MSKEEHRSDKQVQLSTVERKLLEIDPGVFSQVPAQKKEQILQTVVTTMSLSKTHIGPLPDSQTLREYSEIIPNGAERIMAMAEKQSDHRIGMEKGVVNGQVIQSYLGQIFAFLICTGFLICGTICVLHGFEIGGTILGAGGLTGLATAFIKGKDSQKASLSEKRPKSKKE